jgi:hypothetical protein
MTTWSDFTERAGRDSRWVLRDGEGLWTNGEIAVLCRIKVPFNSLSPEAVRIEKVVKDEDVEFEAYFLSGKIQYQEAVEFTKHWLELWTPGQVWVDIIDAPPPGHHPPHALDFTPLHYEKFKASTISKTPMAPLWGQPISYFNELVVELNAGPPQVQEPKVRYQQAWVERNIKCPFCYHSEWALAFVYNLRPEDEWVYDPQKQYYAFLCPRCVRCVESIPRQLVNNIMSGIISV